MSRILIRMLYCALIILSACGQKESSSNSSSQPIATATLNITAASPTAMPSGSPIVGGITPSQIPERLRRPLTREEIMQLPPETRDMILRAQGRPIPSPTKKK